MTPIRINLLPHRQMRRAQQRRIFALLGLLTIAAGIGIVAAGQTYLSRAKADQDKRNVFLKAEIAKLDQQIAEIRQLKEKTQDLLSRKNVVESLQANRGESVRFFDQLARRLPDGLFLKSAKQTGDGLALTGYAQSSARVSTFMRNLDESDLFQDPTLAEVKAATLNGQRINEFSLSVKITRQGASQTTDKPIANKTGAKP
jgi:type IV pilus assembly protein PilN